MAERLIRIGRVSSVDAKNGLIRVTYPDLDDAVTDWLPLFSFTDEYKMPDIRDEVIVAHLSSGQTAGVVLGKYWNADHRPPVNSGFRKELGTEIGEAYIAFKNGVLTIKADTIKISGDMQVTGGLAVDGNVSVGGYLSAAGEVTGSGIKLSAHKHTDSIGGSTSAPN